MPARWFPLQRRAHDRGGAITGIPAPFTLIWELSPAAFSSPATATGDLGEFATMLYFSRTTLITTGYGYIVPVDPFARSLANLESVLGQLYLVITVARPVPLEVEGRRR